MQKGQRQGQIQWQRKDNNNNNNNSNDSKNNIMATPTPTIATTPQQQTNACLDNISSEKRQGQGRKQVLLGSGETDAE